jgi:hypothetical protein
MLKLPLTAFVYTMEMFVKTMEGLRKIADQSIDVMVGVASQNFEGRAENESDPAIDKREKESTPLATRTRGNEVDAFEGRTSVTDDIVTDDGQTNLKEEIKMPDTNLSDEMLKLVRYKILFVKRDYEHAFPEVEELVHDNMTGSAFSGWKIAQFIQNLGNDEIKIPRKWKDKNNYPPDVKTQEGKPRYRDGDRLLGFPEEDKKYLRVYFEVLDRYVREDFRYEEDQIDVLKEIRDALRKKDGSGSSASGDYGGGGSSAGGGGSASGGYGGGGGSAGGGRGTAP